jgi:hypothetical protein
MYRKIVRLSDTAPSGLSDNGQWTMDKNASRRHALYHQALKEPVCKKIALLGDFFLRMSKKSSNFAADLKVHYLVDHQMVY